MKKFTTRIYNSFDTNLKNKNSIIKKSFDSKLSDEIEYYKSIPKELELYFPRLVNSYEKDNLKHLELEYYAYEDLGLHMINEEFNINFWESFFNHAFEYFEEYKKFESDEDIEKNSLLMFIEKTETEYLKLLNNFDFFKLFENNQDISVNGVRILPFELIWPKIKKHITDNLIPKKLHFFHGDFCFNNVLYGTNKKTGDVIFKFIDPRGKFGNVKFYGDLYYDLAKISHSCNGGYEYFINDKFTVNQIENKFELLFSNLNKNKINEIFLKFVDNNSFDITKIKILEGCIYIGMCARHYDSIERQKAMLITGLKILNDVYETI
jgi:hypothetical protein